MPSRTIENYGGIKVDILEVEHAQGEESAGEHNRHAEDTAQMTRTSHFARVWFTTTATAAPTTVSAAAVNVRSHAGNGSAAKPTVAKTATGIYVLTFGATYTDALDVTEPIVIALATALPVIGATAGVARVTGWTDTTVTVEVEDTTFADSDLGGTAIVAIEVSF
jgi:hypothetical protein